MNDLMAVPIAWIKALAALVAGLVFAAFLMGRCSAAPDPAPLPPKVRQDVDRHMAQKAADSATIQLLEADTLAKATRIRALADSQRLVTAAAEVARDSADRLAAIAATANTAETWHAAYTVRTHEADDFQRAMMIAFAKNVLLEQNVGTTSTIGNLYKAEAHLGDVVIQELLPLAEQRDRCRILYILKCPNRKQVFVGGVLAGAAVAAIATGKIKIPVRLF